MANSAVTRRLAALADANEELVRVARELVNAFNRTGRISYAQANALEHAETAIRHAEAAIKKAVAS